MISAYRRRKDEVGWYMQTRYRKMLVNVADRYLPRIGWALSVLVSAFLILDASVKMFGLVPVDAAATFGWRSDPATLRMLGSILLIPTLLYLWPRTNVLGAIIITGYLGGAVETHARIESPLFTHVLFGVYVGAVMWGGLYLRDDRLRMLVPWRR